ncbi:hypothetical protein CLV56_3737 [Mumia flava]|uniref:Uncharacterized protein n=1 Tax=Mumia flava TaxID=1348852 RepID=A0A2M9B8E3_9ACTN|nr:DUF6510 family protein [Mumia flava]PJJ54229.1 hypothetical protein CLV56_3737 [Mumia flava]
MSDQHDETDRETGEDFLDGNVLGGELSAVFVRDLTGAYGRCGGCGHDGPVPAVRVWTAGPGIVARCQGCDHVLLRLVQTDTHLMLDASGFAEIRWPLE